MVCLVVATLPSSNSSHAPEGKSGEAGLLSSTQCVHKAHKYNPEKVRVSPISATSGQSPTPSPGNRLFGVERKMDEFQCKRILTFLLGRTGKPDASDDMKGSLCKRVTENYQWYFPPLKIGFSVDSGSTDLAARVVKRTSHLERAKGKGS